MSLPTTNQAPAPPSVLQVDFSKQRRRLLHLGRGVYAYARPCPACGKPVEPREPKCLACGAAAGDVAYYERPYVGGKQTTRRIEARTLRNAQLQLGKLRHDQALARLGKSADPYSRSSVATITKLADGYLAAGCPKRDGAARTGKQLKDEKRSVQNLVRLLGRVLWTKLTVEDLDDYHAQRIAEVKAGSRQGTSVPQTWVGDRAVEIEERTLSSILRWALRNSRKTGVTANPIAHDRPARCRPEAIRHCRDSMPASAEELHNIATFFFSAEQTEVFGWQCMFESMLGSRSHEIVRLRITADPAAPGHIDGDYRAARLPSLPRERCIGSSPILQLYQSQTSKGTFQYGIIHKALGSMLQAFEAWHKLRYPQSEFYLPCPRPLLPAPDWKPGAKAVAPESLTNALRWACPALGLRRITSHGFRAYYANVLRTHGVPDHEVALLMGHTTRGDLVVKVYGTIPKQKLTWLPANRPPAWARWLPAKPAANGQLELAL